jgi:hypothetical protein
LNQAKAHAGERRGYLATSTVVATAIIVIMVVTGQPRELALVAVPRSDEDLLGVVKQAAAWAGSESCSNAILGLITITLHSIEDILSNNSYDQWSDQPTTLHYTPASSKLAMSLRPRGVARPCKRGQHRV